jgi:alpha-1,2-glucosyltransferase
LGSGIKTIVLGIVALLFRQTNVFWIAVFPAGLAVFGVLKDRGASTNMAATTKENPLEALKESWSQSTLHDCPVSQAGVEGNLIIILQYASL